MHAGFSRFGDLPFDGSNLFIDRQICARAPWKGTCASRPCATLLGALSPRNQSHREFVLTDRALIAGLHTVIKLRYARGQR